jgi:hypothetical protein
MGMISMPSTLNRSLRDMLITLEGRTTGGESWRTLSSLGLFSTILGSLGATFWCLDMIIIMVIIPKFEVFFLAETKPYG